MTKKIITISTHAKGGIKSVVDNYLLSGVYTSYKHHWIKSHQDGNFFLNQFLFVLALLKVVLYSTSSRPIFHIHMAMKGSFFRKLIFSEIIRVFGNSNLIHLHGSEFEKFYKNSSVTVKKLIVRNFEKATTVIVLSESWSKFVLNIAPNSNVQVLNNYVNRLPKLEITENKPSNSLNMLFMGMLGERKGIYDLLEVTKDLVHDGYDVKLFIGGNGEIDKVKKVITELCLNKHVEVLGWVSGDEKVKLFNECDVYVLPSYNEGLPMAILEAMSLGKCVISTKVGGIPELINNGENGFIIQPGNKPELKNVLAKICENRRMLIDIGNNSFDTYKNGFSDEVIIPKIKGIYKKLL